MFHIVVDDEHREWTVHRDRRGRVDGLSTNGFSYSYLAQSRRGEYDVDVDIYLYVGADGDIYIEGVESDAEWEGLAEDAAVGTAMDVAEALGEWGA